MDEQRWLAERFEEHRPHLRAVAYRLLGSLSEADDAVQETWLRASRSNTTEVENLGGWLTTIAARVSLNLLRSRRTRREEPLGPHVPDPIIDAVDQTHPEHEALIGDSLGLALLVVLEKLTPAERLGSSCTRPLRSRSMRSRRSSTALRRPRGSSRVEPVAAFAVALQHPMAI